MDRVYRVTVSSARRLSGTPADFVYDVAGINTGRDFVDGSWLCAVEWITPVTYDGDPDATSLLLTCPTLSQPSSSESWNGGGPSSVIAPLPRLGDRPTFGFAIDAPYVRRSTLGVPVRGDALNGGKLQFRLLTVVASGVTVPPPLPEDAPYEFSLVFWAADPLPPVPPPMASRDFRMWIHTDNRLAGTPSSLDMPAPAWVRFDGNNWMVAAQMAGPLRYSAVDGPQALALVCDNVRDETGNPATLLVLQKYEEYGNAYTTYGQSVSIKPASRDTVGHPLRGQQVLAAGSLSLHLVVADGTGNLATATEAQDWAACLHFFQQF
mmetsp:Transcript_36526/g.86723  ORF Transcript_36526/g.86723 Transcript_36526/m.86723 type:complete len:322 (-) Transcript_36526:207-1172(-)